MHIRCESDFYVSIESAEPSNEDVLVIVKARCPGFHGEIDTWIARDAWVGFCNQLAVLNEHRQGQATVESISPKELHLIVRSIDRLGHMGVEGELGYRGVHGETHLRFSTMAFDPSTLPQLLTEAREIAG
ncbi:hypothetical protein CLU86_2461 [Acidovorax sp. 62]|uniref:hypothetical protein n=1 Tax=unclassified Acidovorax TaxID=2684926 RepID=UPI000C1A3845|nr:MULTISPECIES: hypothetical protein [unclassified Acidovorax]AYM95635.1 hypothetical protein EAG14_05380 [Acidovorax sp. 1608163]PIF91529.1 hypothetical protein CLU86_2461 [Acidovorax sp. 62]